MALDKGFSEVNRKKAGIFLAVAPPFAGLTSGRINAVFMVVGLLLMISKGVLRLPRRIIRWSIPFAAFCFLSYFWASVRTTVISTTLSYLQVIILLLVIIIGTKTEDDTFFVIKCMIFGALVYSVRLFSTRSLRYLVTIGRIGGGNTLAIRFTMLAVMIFLNRKRFRYQILAYGFIFLFSLVGFLQGSRKGFFILTIGLTLSLLFDAAYSRKISKSVRYLFFIAVSMIAVYCVCMYTPLYNSIGVRIERTINYFFYDTGTLDNSAASRSALITDGIGIWKDHPLIGCGQDSFRYINNVRYGYYSHNNFVELLANLGLTGFILYYYIYAEVIAEGRKIFKRRENRLIIIPLTVYFLIVITDYMHVSYSSEANYVFFGYALSVQNIIIQRKKNSAAA